MDSEQGVVTETTAGAGAAGAGAAGAGAAAAAEVMTRIVPRTSIFDIHFLQAQICSHLSKNDIRHCSLVSHAFQNAFQPFLWNHISIVHRSTLKKIQQPEFQSALTQHARYVQSITSVFVEAWPLIYSKCETLRIDPLPDSEDGDEGRPMVVQDRSEHPPPRRTFPNLRTIKSLAHEYKSDFYCAYKMMMLVFPMLDATVAPRLEFFMIDHLDFTQRASAFEFMNRIRQLKTLKKLQMTRPMQPIPLDVVQRILECIRQIEVLKWSLGIYRGRYESRERWENELTIGDAIFQTLMDTYITRSPPMYMEKNRIVVDTRPFDEAGLATITTATGVTLPSIAGIVAKVGTVVTGSATEPPSPSPLSQPTMDLELDERPERYAIKDLDFSFSLAHEDYLHTVTGFLRQCPDIERLVVPSWFLKEDSTTTVLPELLLNWIHLKDMVISTCRHIPEERVLAEIICAAAGQGSQSLDMTGSAMTGALPLPLPPAPATALALAAATAAAATPIAAAGGGGGGGRGLRYLRLEAGGIPLSLPSQAVIQFHSQTLVHVNLVKSRAMDRVDVQRLLCSCPNLEILETMDRWSEDDWIPTQVRDPILYTADMVAVSGPAPSTTTTTAAAGTASCRVGSGQEQASCSQAEDDDDDDGPEWGWICKRLRVLTLRYYPMDTTTGGLTGIPYELAIQLGRMRYLEDLRIGRQAAPEIGHRIPLTPLASLVSPSPASLVPFLAQQPQQYQHQQHQQQQQQQPSGKTKSARIESVSLALRIWAKELTQLKRLELRGLQIYTDPQEIDKAKEAWKQMEWVQFEAKCPVIY
ncbi:hypothetical protein B0O80DRAFT_294594 [Mortierella sp. GBAus27b]|nr:hypothetical protein BGX31_006761 [Mortierella sp. GBA43]KAI8357701.1 hypothetical protein B0O80DRAFT_294594 [Mortierella sp. GBAus27b]